MFWRRRNNERQTPGEFFEVIEEKKYKSFAETFKISSFALAINMMYPRRGNRTKRALITLAMLASFVPAFLMIAIDVYNSVIDCDLDNITRQFTLGIPFFGVVCKMVIANLKSGDFEIVINEISSDLLSANDLSADYQHIVDQYIESGKTGQTVWTIASISVAGIFPIMATILMVNHNLRHNEVKRYMIHDLKIPGLVEETYNSPYFEMVFAYMMYLVFYFVANFTGYDGTFCISVNHGSLKLKLMTHRLRRAFEDAGDPETIKLEIRKVIEEHKRIFEYVGLLQGLYGPWLALVFTLTLAQICLTLYQVTEMDTVDPKYMIFVVGSITHIFVPCHFSSVLQKTAEESSTEIYCCGWENISDKWVTDTVRFMVARAQRPLNFTALNMVVFDMLLFVSMLQTSYSMYTLLTSK